MTERYDHPLRHTLSQMLHERTLPVFNSPVILRSWVYLVADEERAAEARWISSLDSEGTAAETGRLLSIGDNGGYLWERHGEFSVYLCFEYRREDAGAGLGFARPFASGFNWLEGAAGRVFKAIEIVVQKKMPDVAELQTYLDMRQAVCCDVFDGAARIWTDFRLHDGHSGRMFVLDQGLQNDELSRLLQCLIDLGQYRKLALLGFPPARALIGWLGAAEERLVAISENLASSQGLSQQDILDSLLSLSAEVEHRINESRFRQGATEAYYRLTIDRLSTLRERRVAGCATMSDFIERRLQPAMRTCQAANWRLEGLSQRLGRTSDLLRARISISLEVQNQSLLRSMDGRAHLQVKMQALVEGLSVFALSYYIFSLLKYLVDPLIEGNHALTQSVHTAMIVGLVGGCWYFINARKKLFHREIGGKPE